MLNSNINQHLMGFDDAGLIKKSGEKVGYTLSYFLFTTILYFVLILAKKIPVSWSYLHIMGITLIISLVGIVLKRVLK